MVPYLIVGTILAVAAYSATQPALPPASPAADHEARTLARAMIEVHSAALTYAARNPSAVGFIAAATLRDYLPSAWLTPPDQPIVVCIGNSSPTERRAVATWTTATDPDASRVSAALAGSTHNASGAGIIDSAGAVLPNRAAPAYTFPAATCGPIPPLEVAALVTPTLP